MPFAAILPWIVSLAGKWAGSALFGKLVEMGAAVISLAVAAIQALPAMVTAIGGFLKVVAESPLLSFLFGGALVAPFAIMYGLSWDAPIRDRIKANAIRDANARADVAIAEQAKPLNATIADLRKKLAKAEAAAKATKKR